MPKIYYLPDDRTVDSDEGEIILDASLRESIPHTYICGKMGRCSTCRVMVIEGLEHCSDRNQAETVISDRLQFPDNIRLACQTQIFGDVTLRRLAIDNEDLELIKNQITGKVLPETIGKEKAIAILFADLRGFTTFSEQLLPYDVIYILNRYFRKMGEAIQHNNGTINNYMGDGLMALFGVDDSQYACEWAVSAALEMLQEMDKLNPHLELLYNKKLRIGIGIHYGYVVMGYVGAADNPRLTAIGDAVNFASRIESANKKVGSSLLISEAVYEELKEQLEIKQAVKVDIPGKSGMYTLYEVVGMQADCALAVEQWQQARSSHPHIFATIYQFFLTCWQKLRQLFGVVKV